jgi:hypothetical protein
MRKIKQEIIFALESWIEIISCYIMIWIKPAILKEKLNCYGLTKLFAHGVIPGVQ